MYLQEAPKGNAEAIVVAVGQGIRTEVPQLTFASA